MYSRTLRTALILLATGFVALVASENTLSDEFTDTPESAVSTFFYNCLPRVRLAIISGSTVSRSKPPRSLIATNVSMLTTPVASKNRK